MPDKQTYNGKVTTQWNQFPYDSYWKELILLPDVQYSRSNSSYFSSFQEETDMKKDQRRREKANQYVTELTFLRSRGPSLDLGYYPRVPKYCTCKTKGKRKCVIQMQPLFYFMRFQKRERERETERYIKRWMEFVKKYQNIFVLCYRFFCDNLETKFPVDVQSKCSLSFRVIIH